MKHFIFLVGVLLGCSSFAGAQSNQFGARLCDCDESCDSEGSSGATSASSDYRNSFTVLYPHGDIVRPLGQPKLPAYFRDLLKNGERNPSLDNNALFGTDATNGQMRALKTDQNSFWEPYYGDVTQFSDQPKLPADFWDLLKNGERNPSFDNNVLVGAQITNGPIRAFDPAWFDAPNYISQPEIQIIVDPVLTGQNEPYPDVVNVPTSRVDACKSAVRYSSSETNMSCAEAVSNLCDQFGCTPESLVTAMAETDMSGDSTVRARAAIDSFSRYERECLAGDLTSDAQDLGGFDLSYIRDRTGVIKLVRSESSDYPCNVAQSEFQGTSDSDGVFCSAAVIDSTTIVTARHCFVTEQSEWKPEHSCIDENLIQFISLASPDTPIQIESIVDASDVLNGRTRTDQDFVKLRLEERISGIDQTTRTKVPEVFDQVMIVARHPLVRPSPYLSELGPYWRQQVRWTRPRCTVTRATNGCAITKCQTIGGYSGAPVWIIDHIGETALGGIQTKGGTGHFSDCGENNWQSVGAEGNLTIWGFLDDELDVE